MVTHRQHVPQCYILHPYSYPASLLCLLCYSHFHKLPAGLKEGVDLQLGFGIEAGFSALLNIIVLYSIGKARTKYRNWTLVKF